MLKKLIVITFSFLLYFNSSISNDLKIVYVDIDKVINQSNAGKTITKQLEIINNSNLKKFKKIKEKLSEDETNIIKQKNILSKEEFDIKVKTLQKNIKNFKKDVNISRENLNKKKIEGTTQILTILNKILSEYSSKNSISLIIQKKNIVIGMTELDITTQILKIVNTKIKSVKLN
tara:strand:+ start:2083 stop:2607 length:525 start_codon:yes stop_codon:yes gene_type:complete